MADAAAHPAPSRVPLALPLGVTYLAFGSGFVAAKVAVEGGVPPLMLGARFLPVGLALLAACALLGRAGGVGRPRAWAGAAVAGLGMLLGGQGLAVLALRDLQAGTVAVLIASTPLWAALIGHGAGFARLTGAGFGAIGLGMLGVALLGAGALGGAPGAVGLALAGAVAWAVGSTLGERMAQADDRVAASALQMIAGGAALTAASVVAGEWTGFAPSAVTGAAWLAGAWMALVVSLVGFPLFVTLTARASPAVANSFAYVAPAIASGLGVVLLGESFGTLQITGLAVVLASVAMLLRAGSAPALPRAATPCGAPHHPTC